MEDSEGPRCQVSGCREKLPTHTPYFRRYRICKFHCTLPVLVLGGRNVRWCQQCTTFQDVSEFDDTRRSCRRALLLHNARRRKNPPPDAAGAPAAARKRKGGLASSASNAMIAGEASAAWAGGAAASAPVLEPRPKRRVGSSPRLEEPPGLAEGLGRQRPNMPQLPQLAAAAAAALAATSAVKQEQGGSVPPSPAGPAEASPVAGSLLTTGAQATAEMLAHQLRPRRRQEQWQQLLQVEAEEERRQAQHAQQAQQQPAARAGSGSPKRPLPRRVGSFTHLSSAPPPPLPQQQQPAPPSLAPSLGASSTMVTGLPHPLRSTLEQLGLALLGLVQEAGAAAGPPPTAAALPPLAGLAAGVGGRGAAGLLAPPSSGLRLTDLLSPGPPGGFAPAQAQPPPAMPPARAMPVEHQARDLLSLLQQLSGAGASPAPGAPGMAAFPPSLLAGLPHGGMQQPLGGVRPPPPPAGLSQMDLSSDPQELAQQLLGMLQQEPSAPSAFHSVGSGDSSLGGHIPSGPSMSSRGASELLASLSGGGSGPLAGLRQPGARPHLPLLAGLQGLGAQRPLGAPLHEQRQVLGLGSLPQLPPQAASLGQQAASAAQQGPSASQMSGQTELTSSVQQALRQAAAAVLAEGPSTSPGSAPPGGAPAGGSQGPAGSSQGFMERLSLALLKRDFRSLDPDLQDALRQLVAADPMLQQLVS